MKTNPDTNPADTSETPDTQPVLLNKELLETIADTMNLIARYLEKLDTDQAHTQNDAVETQNTDGGNSNTADTEPDDGDDDSDSSEFFSFEDLPDAAHAAETHADENSANDNADGAAQNDDGLDELVDGFDELMDGFGELMGDFVGDMDDFISRADTADRERRKTPMRERPWSEQARNWPVHGAWTTGMIVAKTTKPAKPAQQPGSDNTAADTADSAADGTADSSKPRTIVRRCGPYGIRITRQRTSR